MRSRPEILDSLRGVEGSRQGEERLLKCILETLLDLRELLGVELYLTPPADPEPPPKINHQAERRGPRLPVLGAKPSSV